MQIQTSPGNRWEESTVTFLFNTDRMNSSMWCRMFYTFMGSLWNSTKGTPVHLDGLTNQLFDANSCKHSNAGTGSRQLSAYTILCHITLTIGADLTCCMQVPEQASAGTSTGCKQCWKLKSANHWQYTFKSHLPLNDQPWFPAWNQPVTVSEAGVNCSSVTSLSHNDSAESIASIHVSVCRQRLPVTPL